MKRVVGCWSPGIGESRVTDGASQGPGCLSGPVRPADALPSSPGGIGPAMRSTDNRDRSGTNGNVKVAAMVDACRALVENTPADAAAIIKARYPFVPHAHSVRRYSEIEMMRVFTRDGFIDRYTGARLVFPGALRLVSILLPAEFPFRPNRKMDACHPPRRNRTPLRGRRPGAASHPLPGGRRLPAHPIDSGPRPDDRLRFRCRPDQASSALGALGSSPGSLTLGIARSLAGERWRCLHT